MAHVCVYMCVCVSGCRVWKMSVMYVGYMHVMSGGVCVCFCVFAFEGLCMCCVSVSCLSV